MNRLQARTARALLNIFDSGSPHGAYGRVLANESQSYGSLCYGRAHGKIAIRLADGGLSRLICDYIGAPNARLAKAFASFLPMLRDRNTALHGDCVFHNLLRAAADDPVMRALQDETIDGALWPKSLEIAERLGVETPLGIANITDSLAMGGWETERRRVTKHAGTVRDIGEGRWMIAYLEARQRWLAAHKSAALRNCAPQIRFFLDLARAGLWDLRLPLYVCDVALTPEALDQLPCGTYEGPTEGTRELALQTPILRGADIRNVQLDLSKLTVGRGLIADGVYGPLTAAAIRDFQETLGLPATGTADAATLSYLGR